MNSSLTILPEDTCKIIRLVHKQIANCTKVNLEKLTKLLFKDNPVKHTDMFKELQTEFEFRNNDTINKFLIMNKNKLACVDFVQKLVYHYFLRINDNNTFKIKTLKNNITEQYIFDYGN